jgi:hypothetical protein
MNPPNQAGTADVLRGEGTMDATGNDAMLDYIAPNSWMQEAGLNPNFSGQMLPGTDGGNQMLVHAYRQATGMGPQFSGTYEQMVNSYPQLYAMMNPGAPGLTQTQLVDEAGDFMGQLAGASGADPAIVDPGMLYDNFLSNPAVLQNPNFNPQSAPEGENPIDSQIGAVYGAVESLAPWVSPDAMNATMSMIQKAEQDYRMLLMDTDPTNDYPSFIEYLRSIGASDWL